MASEFPNEPGGVPPQSPIPPSAPAPAGGGMIGRLQRQLMKPREEWARIDAGRGAGRGGMLGGVAPLAAIGPLARAINQLAFPAHVPFLNIVYRPDPAGVIAQAVLTWVLTVAMTYVWALIIAALAPNFGSTKNPISALKVTAFTGTAMWVCGIFMILPVLGILVILGLYSFYLLWVGQPMLMKTPPDKAAGYIIVSIVIGIVAWLVAFMVASAIIGAIFVMTPGVGSGGTISVG